jgi:HEAT repeat protein
MGAERRRAFDGIGTEKSELPPSEEVRRAIDRLTSLREGELGVVEAVACGRDAIPALRQVLVAREPSGLYETRRRAVRALAQLHALDVLIEYLGGFPDFDDPIEQTGEEAVVNAAARAIAEARDPRVLPLLMTLAKRPPLAGVVDALGKLRCAEAIPYFIEALADDSTRSAAEGAIRMLGAGARDALLNEATLRAPPDVRETDSGKRKRRSALELFAEFGRPARTHWPLLRGLMRDGDASVASCASRICLAGPTRADKIAAAGRLVELLPCADWALSGEIEDCLVRHLAELETVIGAVPQRSGDEAGHGSTEQIARALRRIRNARRQTCADGQHQAAGATGEKTTNDEK